MKTISSFTHLFFDLDGTLTESGPGIMNSVRHALRHWGIEETDDDKLRLFIGPPLTESFKTLYGFSEEQAFEAMGVYREYFGVKGLFENSVYDGIIPALEALKKSGKKLYVATGKPEIYMHPILEHFGLKDFFIFAGGADLKETRSKKDLIIEYVIKECGLEEERSAGNILMIGDRKHDISGAKKTGLASCGVLWGYGSREELTQAGADFIIESPQKLSSLSGNDTDCSRAR